MPEPTRLSRRGQGVLGFLLVVLCVSLIALIHFQPQQLRAPAVVAYAAVGSFGVAGLMLMATALGRLRAVSWLAVVATAALVFPAFWLAFGKGKRECRVSIPFVELSSEVACRLAFGVGAIVGIGILAVFVHHAVSHKRGAWR